MVLLSTHNITPGRRQLKILLTIDERRSEIHRNSIFDCICCQSGDKWQSKTLFLTIFDLGSSIVLTFFHLPPTQCEHEKQENLLNL